MTQHSVRRTAPHPPRRSARDLALLGARVGFVVLTLGFAWWGFSGRWSEIVDSLTAVGPWRLGGAVLLAVAGLCLTGVLWRALLAALGFPVAARDAAAVFFVGQLGKYVPGSVWSFAAQAQLGRKHDVPVRSSVTASSLFLMLHTFTGLVVGAGLAAAGAVETDLDAWVWVLAAAAGAIALSPPVLRLLGDRLAGNGVRTRFTVADLGRSALLMAGVWACYGVSLWVLVPRAEPSVADVLTAVGAFALAHVAGVLLVLAPAGLGAREAVLIALLSPAVGVPAAAAAALLSRVAHTLADFLVAAAAGAWARTAPIPETAGVGDA